VPGAFFSSLCIAARQNENPPLLPTAVCGGVLVLANSRNRLRRCALAWKVTQETPSQFRVVHRFGRPIRRENEETENKVGPNAPRRPLLHCRVSCAHSFFPGGGRRCVDSWQPPCCRHGPTGPRLDRSIIYASSPGLSRDGATLAGSSPQL
jgi:hypothetical protein